MIFSPCNTGHMYRHSRTVVSASISILSSQVNVSTSLDYWATTCLPSNGNQNFFSQWKCLAFCFSSCSERQGLRSVVSQPSFRLFQTTLPTVNPRNPLNNWCAPFQIILRGDLSRYHPISCRRRSLELPEATVRRKFATWTSVSVIKFTPSKFMGTTDQMPPIIQGGDKGQQSTKRSVDYWKEHLERAAFRHWRRVFQFFFSCFVAIGGSSERKWLGFEMGGKMSLRRIT